MIYTGAPDQTPDQSGDMSHSNISPHTTLPEVMSYASLEEVQDQAESSPRTPYQEVLRHTDISSHTLLPEGMNLPDFSSHTLLPEGMNLPDLSSHTLLPEGMNLPDISSHTLHQDDMIRSISPQTFFDGAYESVRFLGDGASGAAYLVKDKEGCVFVVKQFHSASGELLASEEVECLRHLRSDHVVKLHDIWIDSVDSRPCLLLEYCDKGDLQAFRNRKFPLHPDVIVSFMAQLLIGLDHVHTKHFLHRDVKLENIFVCRTVPGGRTPTVKIGDFGMGKEVTYTDAAASSTVGTPLYFCPELVASRSYTRKADVWSLGVAMYALMTGKMPFEAGHIKELARVVLHHEPPHPSERCSYPTEIGDAVMMMLTKSRKHRPACRTLLSLPLFRDVLESWPWMASEKGMVGAVGLFACCQKKAINVRTRPSLTAPTHFDVHYGDLIFVTRRVTREKNLLWLELMHPVRGFCVAGCGSTALFRAIQDDSPLPTTTEFTSMDACTVDLATISPLLVLVDGDCNTSDDDVMVTPESYD